MSPAGEKRVGCRQQHGEAAVWPAPNGRVAVQAVQMSSTTVEISAEDAVELAEALLRIARRR